MSVGTVDAKSTATLAALQQLAREGGSPVKGRAGTSDFQGEVRFAIEDAVDYYEQYVDEDLQEATQLYKGEKLGNEEEGRSQIVMTVVRDCVGAIMPSLMRIFFASDNVAEFTPRESQQVEQCHQMTDMVNFVIQHDNRGFAEFSGAFKDALVRKNGFFKWWWEDAVEAGRVEYTGLSVEAIEVLLAAGVVIEDGSVHAEELLAQGSPPTFSAVAINPGHGRVRYAAIPPEEFIFDRDATSLDNAMLVAHRRDMPGTDLVAMGYDRALVLKHASANSNRGAKDTELYTERKPEASISSSGKTSTDPLMQDVEYVEAYIRSSDEDGNPELRKVCTMGPQYEIVNGDGKGEVVSERPFSTICPDPEPHTIRGLSIADRTKDLQYLESALVRNVLDSLAQSIHPRTAAVEGQVNMDDLLNNEIGGIVRERAPGMVRPLAQPFVGKEVFPLFDWADQKREERIGISKSAQGLDADALQSTAAVAAAASVKASQQQVELIARHFAEGGVKDLMWGIARLLVKHQDQPRMVRLRGHFVEVDPREWDLEVDMDVKVGNGTGTPEEKLAFLGTILAKQEGYAERLGPDNEMSTLPEIRHTIARMMELGGFPDHTAFFKEVPEDWQPPEPVEPEKPEPTPDTLVLAETEKMKAELNAKSKAAELEAKTKLSIAELEMKRSREESDHDLKIQEMASRQAIEEGKIQAMLTIEREKLAQGAVTSKEGHAIERVKAFPNLQVEARSDKLEEAFTGRLDAMQEGLAEVLKGLDVDNTDLEFIRDGEGRLVGAKAGGKTVSFKRDSDGRATGASITKS